MPFDFPPIETPSSLIILNSYFSKLQGLFNHFNNKKYKGTHTDNFNEK